MSQDKLAPGDAFWRSLLRSSKSGENLYKIEVKILKCFICFKCFIPFFFIKNEFYLLSMMWLRTMPVMAMPKVAVMWQREPLAWTFP